MTAAKILIVDDDRAMCEMLERRSAKRGFDVLVATSAREALDRTLGEDARRRRHRPQHARA